MTLTVIPWGENPIFEWDEYNERKIDEHYLTCFEIEECFENPYWVAPHHKARSQPRKYGDRYKIRGTTDGGRKLFIIIQHKGGNLTRPITAFDC